MAASTKNREAAYRRKAEEILGTEMRRALVFEHPFCAYRKWRFDIAIIGPNIGIEIDGGTWQRGGGRHNRPQGFADDIDKLNAATFHGWKVIRTTPRRLTHTLKLVKDFISTPHGCGTGYCMNNRNAGCKSAKETKNRRKFRF